MSFEEIMENSGLFKPLFDNVVTLDPSRVEEAWDRLSIDTYMLDIKSLDQIFALALYKTLKESMHNRVFEKIEKEEA